MAIDTKDKILGCAHRLFGAKGYAATSMREISKTVGIGKATIYHHFPDKEAILIGLLEKSLGRMDMAMEVIRRETRPEECIAVVVSESLGFLFDFADIVRIVRRELPVGREAMGMKYGSHLHEYLDLLADAIRRGSAEGRFRDIDPAEAARVLMTMIQGSFAMNFLGGGRADSPETAAGSILDIFFRGIKA